MFAERELRHSANGAKVARFEHFFEISDSVEAITLGNSHNLAINFDVLGISGYHLWSGAEDIFETAQKLEAVLDSAPRLKWVFVPVSFHFFRDNASKPEIRMQHYMVHGTPALPGDRGIWLDSWMSLFSKMDWLGWLGGKKLVRGWGSAGNFSASGQQLTERRFSVLPDQTLRAEAIEVSSKHKEVVQSSWRVNQRLDEQCLGALAELVDATSSRGIVLVLYTPPYFDAYTETMQAEQQGIARIMDSVARHSATLYLDFHDHPSISPEAAYFQDPDHLNQPGSALFSSILKEKLPTHEP